VKKPFLPLSIIAIIVLCFTAGPAFSAGFPQPGDSARRDGDNLVYMGWYNSNWDIFLKNAGSGDITRITDNPHVQGYPDIRGKYIVWQDNRNNPDPETGSYDIYLYDMETKSETKISQTAGYHQEPMIRDGKVVWTDHADGKKDICLYDISAGTQKKISSSGSQAFGIKFDGKAVAWIDFRNGSNDLYTYTLDRQKETRVTSRKDVNMYLVVNDGRVAWAQKDQGYYQIKVLDTGTNDIQTLTSGSYNHRPVSMSGQSVLATRNGGSMLIDIETKKQTPLDIKITDPRQVTLQGDEILRVEGGEIHSQSVASAVSGSGGSGSEAPAKTEPALIRAQQQENITSTDGQAKFSFEPGTFNKDLYLTLAQEESKISGFIPVSPVYSLTAEEASVQKPFKATISYKVPAGENYKKAALYQKQNNTWQSLPFTREAENILSAEIGALAPVAVLIKPSDFKDMTGHWSKQDVEVLASHGIINGYTDGTFRPDLEITRAEFVAILVNSSRQSPAGPGDSFSDVPATHWAASAIRLAREKGWVGGYPGNRFLPDQTITREEMVAILMRCGGAGIKEDTGLLKDYSDYGNISDWAKGALNDAVALGLIKGYKNQLLPGNNTTRAEAAVIFYRYLGQQKKI